MSRPRILDLFCGAGGAAMGYHQAGFDVVGVDINPQPHYPFEFIQADVMVHIPGLRLNTFDAIHASPPCQRYSAASNLHGNSGDHPNLIEPVRQLLHGVGKPFVIENVMGAPLRAMPIVLCGTQFGLRIIKHRQFESNWNLRPCDVPCDHSDVYDPWHGPGRGVAKRRLAQDTPWIPMAGGASRKRGITGDVFNAIPPAYTRFIGQQLIAHLQQQRKAA
jgi:DNA (cytosine-5)-methyltransferase 1